MVYGGSILGTLPLGVAYLGAMVDNQIPVLIPFVIISAITAFRFGTINLAKFLLVGLLYALFRSFLKGKDNTITKVSKLAIASIISNVLLMILEFISVTSVLTVILEIVFTIVFYLIFKEGLRFILGESTEQKEDEQSSKVKSIIILKDCLEETVCCGLLLVMAFSGFNDPIVFGISIFSLVSILALMIICCKKPVLPAILISLITVVSFMLINGFGWQVVLLYIIVGIVTSLFARAKKKGILVGFVFAVIYSLIFSFNHDNIYNEYGMNPRLLEDYAKFIQTYKETNSGETKSGDINTFDNKEAVESIKNSSKPSESSIVLKEMAIGFLVLLLLPDSFYERKNEPSKIELFIKKIFPDKKVLALNAGKQKKAEQESSKGVKKGNTKKKSTKNKKK